MKPGVGWILAGVGLLGAAIEVLLAVACIPLRRCLERPGYAHPGVAQVEFLVGVALVGAIERAIQCLRILNDCCLDLWIESGHGDSTWQGFAAVWWTPRRCANPACDRTAGRRDGRTPAMLAFPMQESIRKRRLA